MIGKKNNWLEKYPEKADTAQFKGLVKEQKMHQGGVINDPSIVNYLASHNQDFSRQARAELAQELGVSGYDYSAQKNLELLARLKQQQGNNQGVENGQITSLPEHNVIASPYNRNVPQGYDDNRPQFKGLPADASVSLQQSNNRFNPPDGFDTRQLLNRKHDAVKPQVDYKGFLDRGNQSLEPNNPFEQFDKNVAGYAKQPEQQPDFKSLLDKGQPIQRDELSGFDKRLADYPEQKPIGQLQRLGTKPPMITDEEQYSRLPKSVQNEVKQSQQPISYTWNNVPIDTRMTVSGKPKDIPQTHYLSDLEDLGMSSLSSVVNKFKEMGASIEDAKTLAKNYVARQQLKWNDNLKEPISKIELPQTDKLPTITKGSEIPDDDRRIHSTSIVDLKKTNFGIRNRGDYTEREGDGIITTFQPFQPAKDYFAKNKVKDSDAFIGVDKNGNLKVGNKNDFAEDDNISKTFENKIVDFKKNGDKIALVPSNPKASKAMLSPAIRTIDDTGKEVEGRMNLLVPKNGLTNTFGNITGGKVIFKKADGSIYYVSGSVDDISKAFYKIKGNEPYLSAYTLDNGSYATGLQTKDKKLTSEDLHKYDLHDSGGGNFLYLKPGDYSEKNTSASSLFDKQYSDFVNNATQTLQSLYPNQQVEIKDLGKSRDVSTQAGLQKQGASQTDVSLHNLGAARDYDLYVNGKRKNDPELQKKVLWDNAEKAGLYHLDPKGFGKGDAHHIGVVQEDGKTTFLRLLEQYPELKNTDEYEKLLKYLDEKSKTGNLSANESYVIRSLKGIHERPQPGITSFLPEQMFGGYIPEMQLGGDKGVSQYTPEEWDRTPHKKNGGSTGNWFEKYGDGGKQLKSPIPTSRDGAAASNHIHGSTSGREVQTNVNHELPPFIPYTEGQIRNMEHAQDVVRAAPQRKGKAAKALDIARNPMTALQSLSDRGSIPDNFDKGERNIYDNAMDFVNPMVYADAIGRTLSAKHFRDMVDEKGKIDWNKLPDAIVQTGLDAGMVTGLGNEVKGSYFPSKGSLKFADVGFENQHGVKWYNDKPYLWDITDEGKPIVGEYTSGKRVDNGDNPVYNNLKKSTKLSKEQIEQIKNAKMSPEDVQRLKDIKNNHNTFKGDLDEWENYKKTLPKFQKETSQLKPESQHLSDEAQGVSWDEYGPTFPDNYIQPTDADYIKIPAKGGIPNGTTYTTKSGKTYRFHNEYFPEGHPISPEAIGDQVQYAEQVARPGYQQLAFDFTPANNPSTNPLLFSGIALNDFNQPTPTQYSTNNGYVNIQTQQLQDSVAQPKLALKADTPKKLKKYLQQSPKLDTPSQQPSIDKKAMDNIIYRSGRAGNPESFHTITKEEYEALPKKQNGGTTDNTRTQQPFIPQDRPQQFPVIRQAPDDMALAHNVGQQQANLNAYDDFNKNYIQPIQMVNDKIMDAESLIAAPELLANLGKGAIRKLAKAVKKSPTAFMESNVGNQAMPKVFTDMYPKEGRYYPKTVITDPSIQLYGEAAPLVPIPKVKAELPEKYREMEKMGKKRYSPFINGPAAALREETTPYINYVEDQAPLTKQEEVWKNVTGKASKKNYGGWLKNYK